PETLDLSFHLSLDLELFLALDPRRRSKVMRTKFAIAVLALACAARAADDLQLQEATGQAAVLNGDKPAAREKAIDDALRQAVKMAVGTQVQSVTEVQEFQTKMDTVLEHSTGYVKRYEILKEGMDGEVVQVTVRAQVSLAALDKDLEAMGLLMARKNFPRTMVLIAEQNIGMAALGPDWHSCSANLSARAVNTDNGEVLAAVESTQNAAALDDLSCGRLAIKKAAQKLTEQVVQKIGARWSEDVSGGNAVHVT